MRLPEVQIRNQGITVNHIQTVMHQQSLKGENFPTLMQEGNSESKTKVMHICHYHAGQLGNPFNRLAERGYGTIEGADSDRQGKGQDHWS